MRVHHRESALASLAVRDHAVVRAAVSVYGADLRCGPLATVAAGQLRFFLRVARPARTALPQCRDRYRGLWHGRHDPPREPIGADADAARPRAYLVLDEALRRRSARMVGGYAVLMVTSAAAVTAALMMPTYQAAWIAYLVLERPRRCIVGACSSPVLWCCVICCAGSTPLIRYPMTDLAPRSDPHAAGSAVPSALRPDRNPGGVRRTAPRHAVPAVRQLAERSRRRYRHRRTRADRELERDGIVDNARRDGTAPQSERGAALARPNVTRRTTCRCPRFFVVRATHLGIDPKRVLSVRSPKPCPR